MKFTLFGLDRANHFCLGLDDKDHIGPNEFWKINWILAKRKSFAERIARNVFRHCKLMKCSSLLEIHTMLHYKWIYHIDNLM